MKLTQMVACALVCQSIASNPSAIAEKPNSSAPATVEPAEGAMVVRQSSITPAKETTRITEPLTAEGYPDYVEHLNRKYSRGITPENNAVVKLWQIVGPKEVDANIREEYFRRLGVPVPAETGDYLLELHEYATNAGLVAAGDNDKLWAQLDEAMHRPWKEKEFPVLAKWLSASQHHLQGVLVMSQRPHHYAPLVTTAKSFRVLTVQLPSMNKLRQIARALIARAMLRLGEKDLEGAWSDIMAVRRLSRLAGQGHFVVDGFVAIAVASMANDAEAAVMHFGRPTRLQIAQFRRQRDAIAPLKKFADWLDEGERLMTLDCMCGVERRGPSSLSSMFDGLSDKPGSPAAAFFRIALNCCVDWDAALKASNEMFDRYVAAARIANCQERNRMVRRYDEWHHRFIAERSTWTAALPLLVLGGKEGRKLAGRLMAGFSNAMLMPVLGMLLQAEQRMETIERRSAIVMALADYRAEHDAYPAKLAELVPKYVKVLPRDAFTDAEFRYERTDNGFLLNSLGANGVNDFGRGYDEQGGPTGDDWLLTMPPKPRPQ